MAKKLILKGKELSVVEFANKMNISPTTVYRKLKMMSEEEIVNYYYYPNRSNKSIFQK